MSFGTGRHGTAYYDNLSNIHSCPTGEGKLSPIELVGFVFGGASTSSEQSVMFLCGRYLDHRSAASRSEIIASPWTTPEGNRQDEGQQSGLEACQAHRYRTATCAVDLDSVQWRPI